MSNSRASRQRPYWVKYQEIFWGTSPEDAYKEALYYLSEVVGYGDQTAFQIEEVGESGINNNKKEENV